MGIGSEGSVLDPQRLQELRTGGNSSDQAVETAPASVHSEEEIEEMRRRAALRVANGAESIGETFGHGGEVYGAYVAPKKPQGQVPGPL